MDQIKDKESKYRIQVKQFDSRSGEFEREIKESQLDLRTETCERKQKYVKKK